MTCQWVAGVPVLPDRHTEDCAGDCPGCLPCPEPHCVNCHRSHAEGACPRCLHVARTNLATIADLHDHLATEATMGRAAHHVHTGIPGGDALALLVPGPTTATYADTLAQRLQADLDTSHTVEENRADPRPPLTVLAGWADLWRASTGTPTTLPPTMGRVVDYLDDQLHHLGRDDLFPALYRDLSRTVRRLEDVLHDGVRPEITRVPCLECGTRLVKRWADTEELDHWVCPRCGDHYDRGRYERAKFDHLHSEGADRYVPVSMAVEAIGRPRATVWAWIRSGKVETRRDPVTGRMMAWWPDVRHNHVESAIRLTRRKSTT